MRIGPNVAVAAALTLLLTACGGSDSGDDGGGGTSGGGEPVTDGTFTTAISADPGNLHPHLTVLAATRGVASYMYDKLVHFAADGDELPWLAESWDVQPDSVTFTIQDGVTCSDGSPLTAGDVAANFEFVADPANQSPVLGVMVPPVMEVSSDDAARTVTVTVPSPDPFLLHTTGELFIACRAGLDDPSLLDSTGIGTGMYQLTDAAADDHYTFERRDEYTWGPDGAAASDPGTPKTINLRVIANESTAVNLFLSGELNAVSAVGADRQRLADGDHEELTSRGIVGELFFNQADGRVGADQQVRAALAQALDFEELMSVITGGFGARSQAVAAIYPVCQYDAVDGNLPVQDVDAARAALDAAGWVEGSDGVRAKGGEQLAMTLIYNSTRGDSTAAAAELMASRWSDIGVAATTRGMPPTEYNEVVFGSGSWDAALLPINVRLPSQLVPFLSGATPPEGVNLAHLENQDYQDAVTEAMTIPGEESCEMWQEAEQALFAAYDLVLFADETIPYFLSGASFELGSDNIVPPTIRLSAR